VADECRYPRLFATPVAGDFLIQSPIPESIATRFDDRWHEHLQGIYENAPKPFAMPSWALPL
jgi:hypothetical protein